MPTLGSMFSGCGLLDAGLERAGFDVIWHAETDAAASRVLEAHWPGVPNLGDVAAVDWEQVERPDVLCGGGWPCQPISTAGAQKGETDDRYLWPEVTRALRVLRPRHFVMEQSSALLARKFRPIWLTVLADLAEVGFDAEWAVVRASDVGAPHRRERLFLVAHANGPGRSGEQGAPAGRDGLLGAVGDDPDGRRLARWGQYTAAIARWEAVTGELAPDPLDTRGRLNVELSRWMMGAVPGWHGGESRTAALRMYGNGVVTQVAEAVGGWLSLTDR